MPQGQRAIVSICADGGQGSVAAAGGSMMSIDFLVTSLIVVVSPGTGVLYTLATGLSRGGARQRRRGVRLHARHRAAHGGGDHGPGGAAAHQRASPSRRSSISASPTCSTWPG